MATIKCAIKAVKSVVLGKSQETKVVAVIVAGMRMVGLRLRENSRLLLAQFARHAAAGAAAIHDRRLCPATVGTACAPAGTDTDTSTCWYQRPGDFWSATLPDRF